MSQAQYESPTSLSRVHDLLAEHGSAAKVVAGGQTTMLMVRQDVIDAELFVDISDVPELSGVTRTDDEVRIGAATTYTQLRTDPVADEYRGLGDAVDSIADRQIRNMGTVGGALAHADPSLDIVPQLLCLDATLQLSSVDGTRTVPLEAFLVDLMETDLEAHEIIREIRFDRPTRSGWGSSYVKRSNVSGGWPTVGVGARIRRENGRVDSARVALAAVAFTTVSSPAVEAHLEGTALADLDVEAAGAAVTEDIDPIADNAGSVAYKEYLATVVTQRAIETALERGKATSP